MAEFWDQVEKTDGCWNWTGKFRDTRRRYGVFSDRGRSHFAHRLAYELVKGAIPDGLQIDHLCRNTRCVNPDHLEAVTPRENTLRGTGVTARNAAATHCHRGHEFTPENTLIEPDGPRSCRACAVIRHTEWRKRNPEAAIESDRRKRQRRAERVE